MYKLHYLFAYPTGADRGFGVGGAEMRFLGVLCTSRKKRFTIFVGQTLPGAWGQGLLV